MVASPDRKTQGNHQQEKHAAKPAITSRLFQDGAKTREVDVSELKALAVDDARFVWVDLSHYHAPDLHAVASELGLPEEAVQKALHERKRPRVEVYGDRFYVVVAMPTYDARSQRVQISALDLFVGRNYLVSAHHHPLPFTARALDRAVQNPVMLKLDSAFLLSILIDELLAHFDDLAGELEEGIEEIEERALADESDAFLNDLLAMKRRVFAIFRIAGKHRAIIETILRPDFPLAGGAATAPYFRDLSERLGHLLDRLEAAKESINGAFDLYVSQVSRRTNDIMKVLAIVSTVVLPTSIILAFFGTSFQSLPIDTGAGFVVMMIAIICVTAAVVSLFYRWGWIGRASRRMR